VGEPELKALDVLQRLVTDAVRRTSPIADDEDLVRRVEALVAPGPRGMKPAERLDVYREQFWLRHLPSLREDYPTLVWAVGSGVFSGLVTEYLRVYPPRVWNLQELGADLPAYVLDHAPWSGDPIAVDAARLDWAFMEAFDAPDAPLFDPRVLAATPEDAWMGARVVLHPSLRALELAYPLYELREALKRGEARERPAARASQWVVWRDAAAALHAAEVPRLAFELLTTLKAGVLLGEACERLERSLPKADASELSAHVSQWFQEWTARGWVSAVQFGV
jgi:hypothetical protein